MRALVTRRVSSRSSLVPIFGFVDWCDVVAALAGNFIAARRHAQPVNVQRAGVVCCIARAGLGGNLAARAQAGLYRISAAESGCSLSNLHEAIIATQHRSSAATSRPVPNRLNFRNKVVARKGAPGVALKAIDNLSSDAFAPREQCAVMS